ncbi:hypothetical protein K488DRAFT_15375, partial [Vararia minispora EC-137]
DAEDGKNWVRLHSKGFSFIVKKKVAVRSAMLKDTLSSNAHASYASSDLGRRPIVTETVVEYLAYKTTYENAEAKEKIPDFYERIPPEIALELCV